MTDGAAQAEPGQKVHSDGLINADRVETDRFIFIVSIIISLHCVLSKQTDMLCAVYQRAKAVLNQTDDSIERMFQNVVTNMFFM